jgi:hypothetical protein
MDGRKTVDGPAGIMKQWNRHIRDFWMVGQELGEGGFRWHMRYPSPTGQLQLLAGNSAQSGELLPFSPYDPLSRLRFRESFPNSGSETCLS